MPGRGCVSRMAIILRRENFLWYRYIFPNVERVWALVCVLATELRSYAGLQTKPPNYCQFLVSVSYVALCGLIIGRNREEALIFVREKRRKRIGVEKSKRQKPGRWRPKHRHKDLNQ